MTTTIATMSAAVESRLGVTAGSGNEPTDAQVKVYCNNAFQNLVGKLPPVVMGTGTITSRALTITTDRVFFVVANNFGILLPGVEWIRTTTGIRVIPAVLNGETVNYWHFSTLIGNGPAAISSASTTVNTTCIFGTDWLEELATVQAMMDVCAQLMNTAPSQSGADFGAMYRTFQDQYNQLFAQHSQLWQQWYAEKQQELNDRRMFGRRLGTGDLNEIRITNETLGVA